MLQVKLFRGLIMKLVTTGIFFAGLAAAIGVSITQTTEGIWNIKTPPIPAMDITINTGEQPTTSVQEVIPISEKLSEKVSEEPEFYQSLPDRDVVFALGTDYLDVSGEGATQLNYNIIALEGQQIVITSLFGQVKTEVFTPSGGLLSENEPLPITGKYKINVRAASPYTLRIKVN
ncbi:MAG: hypothetical protein GDA48_24920 [Hormoscilla sp. GM102CHS1]|nr:hypothetical protein [Hormoscilla sp. GM102CHS1]